MSQLVSSDGLRKVQCGQVHCCPPAFILEFALARLLPLAAEAPPITSSDFEMGRRPPGPTARLLPEALLASIWLLLASRC